MGMHASHAHGDGSGSRSGRDLRFEAFFRAHYPAAVRIAWSVVRDSQLAQDVMIAVRRRFPDLADGRGAGAWVRVAAVHLGLNSLRGERRRDVRQRRSLPLAAAGPEEIVIAREEQAAVRDALARLPGHSATVLVLRHSGLSYAEVAEAMGVRAGHVGTMLRRAEAALAKEVDRGTRP